MQALVVEDDFTSRLLLQKMLARYADCDMAENGREALEMFKRARARRRSYDLICLDIMMPEMDGQTVLREIRAIEDGAGARGPRRAKIIMTTALSDFKNVSAAFWELCDEYLVKPINRHKLIQHLGNLGLLTSI